MTRTKSKPKRILEATRHKQQRQKLDRAERHLANYQAIMRNRTTKLIPCTPDEVRAIDTKQALAAQTAKDNANADRRVNNRWQQQEPARTANREYKKHVAIAKRTHKQNELLLAMLGHSDDYTKALTAMNRIAPQAPTRASFKPKD